MVYRIYVSKKPRFDSAKQKLLADLNGTLGVPCDDVTTYIRYDVEGIDEATLKGAIDGIFSEPPVDDVTDRLVTDAGDYVLIVEYLEGQYDQRTDSAMQCVQLYTGGARPLVRCATVYRFRGVKAEDVVVASTGVIGQPLSILPIREGMDALVKSLGDRSGDAAEAIMTTDTVKKEYAVEIPTGPTTAVIRRF